MGRVVLGADQSFGTADLMEQPVDERATMLPENGGAVFLIERQDLAGLQAHSEPDGDDAAGRCADDQIKITTNGKGKMRFKLGQDRRRIRSGNAATINRQNAMDRRLVHYWASFSCIKFFLNLPQNHRMITGHSARVVAFKCVPEFILRSRERRSYLKSP